MKRLIITILLLLINIYIFANSYSTQAQEARPQNQEIQGLLLSPGIIELEAPSDYKLHIENNTSQKISLNLAPRLFKIDSESEKVIPVTEKTVPHRTTNFNEYIKLELNELNLNPREKTDLSIAYLKKHPDYLLGVAVKYKNTNQAEEIGATGQIASIIKNKLTGEDMGEIGSLLEIIYIPRIAEINLHNSYTIFSGITNNSSNVINPTGEIFIEKVNGDTHTRIDHIDLTTQINKTIYPSKDVSLQTEYVDPRPFWERLGKISYKQVINLNGQSIVQQREIFAIPWEIIAIVLISIFVIGTLLKKTLFRPSEQIGLKKHT